MVRLHFRQSAKRESAPGTAVYRVHKRPRDFRPMALSSAAGEACTEERYVSRKWTLAFLLCQPTSRQLYASDAQGVRCHMTGTLAAAKRFGQTEIWRLTISHPKVDGAACDLFRKRLVDPCDLDLSLGAIFQSQPGSRFERTFSCTSNLGPGGVIFNCGCSDSWKVPLKRPI
jgi:hypothetical protein